MPCDWSVSADEPTQVVFVCATCGRSIGFAKPGYGDPNPIADGPSWIPPENVLDWMDACP